MKMLTYQATGRKDKTMTMKEYAMKEVKWSQWSPNGLVRCGRNEYKTIMGWMKELYADAKKCVEKQEKPHAISGRVMHDEDGHLTEIRLYCDAYLTDEELDVVSAMNPHDTLWVAHKHE